MTDKKISNVRHVRRMGTPKRPGYPRSTGWAELPGSVKRPKLKDDLPMVLGGIKSPTPEPVRWLIQAGQLEVVRVRCCDCGHALWEKGLETIEMKQCEPCGREFEVGTTIVLEAQVIDKEE